MSWNDGISGPALTIAQSEANPLRVMAGPGTGKSFAMQRRVARLLEEGIDPQRILAVTFTRNAAANLVQDLKSLNILGCENIRSGTLHSFCFSLLAKRNIFEFLGRVARPMITFLKSKVYQFECKPMLEDIAKMGSFGGKRERTKSIIAFEAAWARLQHESPGWPTSRTDRYFQESLLKWLRFHEAILIGELVPEALRFVRGNPNAPELNAFDHVIVDEYQDLNKAEQTLLDIISGNGSFTIVGDEDQSIYSFRHANPEGIIDFKNRHPEVSDEPLEECYRCPKRVVELADHLILNNHPADVEVRLLPREDRPEGEIHIVQWQSFEQEAHGLAQFVKLLIDQRGYSPGDILILSPRRHLGYKIRDALDEHNVPTHSFYHEEALETLTAQEAFTILNLLVNHNDRVSLRFWLGLGSPSWNSGEYARLLQQCETTGQSPREILELLCNGKLTLPRTTNIKRRYQELSSRLNDLRAMDCAQLVDNLFQEGNADLKTLHGIGLNVIDSISTHKELLDDIRIRITQPEMPEEGNYVRIMSLHKSKGLTSKVAIVAGCIHGLIPTIDLDHTPSEAEHNLKEQRRLFYVSITRCKEILVVSSFSRMEVNLAYKIGAQVRGRRGVCGTITSSFIDELGPSMPNVKIGEELINEFK